MSRIENILKLILILLIIGGICYFVTRPDPFYSPFPENGRGIKYFQANGIPIEYSDKGSYYRSAFYRDGVPDPDSLAIDYYLTGQKKAEGYIISENPDVFNGDRITYYKSGQIESKQTFKAGVPSSNKYSYEEDGRISSIIEFKKGRKNGNHTIYNNGKKSHVLYYKDDILWHETYYYPNGRIMVRHTYKDSNQEKMAVVEYYESGRIKMKATVVKDPSSNTYKAVGDVYNYDEKGRLMITNYDPKPTTEQSSSYTSSDSRMTTRKSTWDRGYDYGYDAGYEDAWNANGAWASYNSSGKGGEFLDGYTSGYEDGYNDGKDDRKRSRNKDDEDDDEIEEL
ncbi:MAG: hypothetical protein IJM35_09955 [Bacteroidales bacterium]|nr:hypothetical protein [Bacteroidales bacterium]